MSDTMLQQKVREQVKQHGSLRAAARALKVDHGYLSRLASGKKKHPNAALLRKLGLVRMVIYAERVL